MRIAIVSSLDELCGNASFSELLVEHLNEFGHEVEGVAIDTNLTQSYDPRAKKMARDHVREICNRLANFDGVNIQFEAGLYGSTPKDILSRFTEMVRANPNTTVTLHANRYFLDKGITLRKVFKALSSLNLKLGFNLLAILYDQRRQRRFNRSIPKTCAKHGVKVIVHTEKSRKLLLKMHPTLQVSVHPIKFTEYGVVKSNREKWIRTLGLKQSDHLIGLFGFISSYKGYQTALRAMEHLPANYKLLIVGRQHPGSIVEGKLVDEYLNELISYLDKGSHETSKRKSPKKPDSPLSKRVIFVNELGNKEFFSLAASVNTAWLPYVETGQDGSGIASILFDLAPRLIASNCKAFDELIKLVPQYRCERFDIGNYLELAQKTQRYIERRNRVEVRTFTLSSQTKLYSDLLMGG